MDKHILTRLFIPLVILAILSIVLNLFVEFHGFFINLATELIGIILTVMYVDYIIKKRETEKWQNVENKISHALSTLVNATISTVRTAFGYGIDILDYEVERAVMVNPTENINLMHKELMRISKEILEPTALARTSLLDQNGWISFIKGLQYLYESAEKFLTVHGAKLTPKQYELLIEFQEAVSKIMIPYTSFPDIIGVPDDKLPKGTRTPANEMKSVLNESLAKDIRGLLSKVCELGANLNNN